MAPVFTVFVSHPEATQKQVNIIKALDKHTCPMVDAVNGTDLEFLRKNYTGNHRFFFLSETLSMNTADELEKFAPDFVVVFPMNLEISVKDWVCISRYLESWFIPSIYVTDTLTARAQELLVEMDKPKLLSKTEDPPQVHFNEHYDLRTELDQVRDIMYIEVEKPFCDFPYTVVIKKFSERGLLPFFTDLFVATSWGVARADYEFLQEVWKKWDMPGEFDINALLKDATTVCYPAENYVPIAEPKVYRRSLDQVRKNLDDEFKHGCVHYMDDDWNEDRAKRRKLEDDLLIN